MTKPDGPPLASFGAISDVRILDLTQMLAGPFCTMMLADHGADVIKIESPAGDMIRPGGPFRDDDTERTHGGYFQSVNRNKKGICLDLKTEAGRDALKELVKGADAVVENFRVGVMERLGLGYEVLREINPRLVYGCLRGFGDTRTGRSPYADWPAFDVVAQAMGGIMGITGADADTPTKVGPGVGDIVPGMMLAFGIVIAVLNAKRTGKGQLVDISMVDSILAVCERIVYQHSLLGQVSGPQGNHHPFMCPFGIFPASDGFVTLATPQDSFFQELCELLGVAELGADERFLTATLRGKNQGELIPLLNDATSRLTKADLTSRLGGRIPFGPVLDIREIGSDPHFQVRQMIVPIDQPGSDQPTLVAGVPLKLTETPGGVYARAPYLGEHTDAVLRDAGFDEAAIAALKAAGAAIQAKPSIT